MTGAAPQRSLVVGLIGAGIQSSRSPALHEAEGAAQGLRYVYKLLDLDAPQSAGAGLADLLAAAQRCGFAGVNVTHPCKQAVIALLDELAPDAAALGAVNTVVFREGRRVGHNTDWSGFAESFRRELPDVRRERVLLLGAGGAGAAVAHALLTLDTATLLVADVAPRRAAVLVEQLQARFGRTRASLAESGDTALPRCDGVVNATPVGMAKYPGMPIARDSLRREHWVADIVYFPLETELLRTARALGCRTMSGGGMAVFQAVGAFRLFTRLEPDADRMLRHFARL